MAKKMTDVVKFGLWVVELFQLFQRADEEEFRAARKAKNLSRICKALGVSEREYKTFVERGRKLTQSFLRDSVKDAALVIRKSIKK